MKRLALLATLVVAVAATGFLFFWGGRRDLTLERVTQSDVAVRVYYEIPSLYYRLTGFGGFIVETTKDGVKKRLDPGVYYDFKGSAVWSWRETTMGGGVLEERYYAMEIEVSPTGELRMIKAPKTESSG